MALVFNDNDPWLIEYESCEKLYREIEGLLNVRELEQKSSEKYVLYSSQIRLRLKQFTDEVQQLSHKLRGLATSKAVTLDEEERRQRMLELLQSRNILLNQRFQNRNNSHTLERQELMRPSTSKAKKTEMPTTGWLDSDDDDYDDKQPLLSEKVLKQQQQYLLKEQDDRLNELASIVSRQKSIAITISSEVDLQNELVDDLLVAMDKTAAGIESETKEVVQILKKDSTRGLWVIIILLLIANVVVALS
ncbi:syntaxin-8-like [Acyrthosiphon pisum]|uniref:ACYPI005558 protein n=1 Tax=Acyrthosiphon pisum TaxID=7029 RepID=C4WVL0_ACYPI|nr:syntaxin-8-like [Acyrthosiphon pisum]BAH71930.1 ACYPI005558 [Acyrthosiphon pisum]|eukprot:NP_001156190.1 syntaxin-8-like [Acyrthosiphon pisum]